MSLSIKVEFGGGLELLFGNQRIHHISLPLSVPNQRPSVTESSTVSEKRPSDMSFLLHWLKDNLLKERKELFLEGDTV